ncbi:DUF6705 family protein [Elizabethkingia anophelis]|uniref:DUF6705 family protein n=1 Tax=Elizabethkingia anophelis TaxID=1117645 RepID=UPI0004E3EDA9|nr:DUF6705 family protein [Elizabethkingia anophelis]KFC35449.1 hypothetical protein FF18_03475 [Elizabethkingia anophelis]MCT3786486.1 hypothetical protein [Elizabethkingia anophelis]
MKNYLIIFTVFLCSMAYSQTTISLEQAAAYQKVDTIGIPESVQYVKDTNNKLAPFVGIWKGTDNRGRSYEIRLIKKENYGKWDLKWDKLLGRIQIKDASNNILYSSLNNVDGNTFLNGENFQHNTYVMYFVGNAACNDFGNVFIEIPKSTPNKMTLFYAPDSDILNPAKCPNVSTYELLLPTDKITLDRQ